MKLMFFEFLKLAKNEIRTILTITIDILQVIASATELVAPFPNVLATPTIRSPVFVKCIVFMALTGLKMYLNRCGAKIFIGHLMRTATLVSIFLIATQPIRI